MCIRDSTSSGNSSSTAPRTRFESSIGKLRKLRQSRLTFSASPPRYARRRMPVSYTHLSVMAKA